MSFFNKIFSNNERDSTQNKIWKIIESEDDLKNAIDQSFHHKIALFKHSTSCFISKMVLKNFERDFESIEVDTDMYFLDLKAHRSISNKIAEEFEIRHESPQLLVLENGKVINNASHEDISINQIL
ncbi:bacillithiol system redox-active protein YtxJ [Chryseobacterium nematophagum]|uniref:Bacillithiol system redox-active protein YtxJ n=1 Tax=Chryseobacterium nematophagum TaxID=2305228 RepID=A0A3M7THN8_9FLAO|nr:bacillithiol system redox-active protein YtxJ [Chryseobacterium nematophagum]RNA62407.1 bacillithiol system redox-active protein YtxJ [Chryseobacterium nematophagum]